MFRLISALCVFIAINASTVAVAMTEGPLDKTHRKENRKALWLNKIWRSLHVSEIVDKLINDEPINKIDGFDLVFFFDVRDYARENEIFDTDQKLYNALVKIPLNCQRGANIIKKILNDEPIENDFKRVPKKHRTEIASVIEKVIRGEYIDTVEEDFFFYMKGHLRKNWIFDVGTLNAIMQEIPIDVTPFLGSPF